jgi:hypothetical protein
MPTRRRAPRAKGDRRVERLWHCPQCGRGFANRNQTHFCSQVTLEAHFRGKPAESRRLFDAFVAAARAHGPVKVLPVNTRIALQVRMSFAAVVVRRGYLRGHLVLAERHERPCFSKVETYSPRNHVHSFELRDPAQLRGDLEALIGDAYKVGRQDHLGTRRRSRHTG